MEQAIVQVAIQVPALALVIWFSALVFKRLMDGLAEERKWWREVVERALVALERDK